MFEVILHALLHVEHLTFLSNDTYEDILHTYFGGCHSYILLTVLSNQKIYHNFG